MEDLADRAVRSMKGGFHPPKIIWWLMGVIFGYFFFFRILDVDSYFGYVNQQVESNQVGIKFYANQPYEVVPPGVYYKIGFFQTLKTVKIEGLSFTSNDPEILTKDKQRISVFVQGTVHRPGLDKSDILLQNWSSYATFYQRDEAIVGSEKDKIPGLMFGLGQQAMKVCVGDSDFDKVVIGSSRDDLRNCVDKELDKLAKGYGLEVRNIVVPNIPLTPEVQKQLDQITQARFATEVANQQKLLADAEAQKNLATQKGTILVEQGKVQEKAKQDAVTADLEQRNQAAQYAVIEATKKNELFTANQNLAIQKVNQQIAEERAKADLAPKLAEALIYQNNPRYVDVVNTQAVANAYKSTDKVIVPVGTSPIMVIGGGQIPQVNVQAPAKP